MILVPDDWNSIIYSQSLLHKLRNWGSWDEITLSQLASHSGANDAILLEWTYSIVLKLHFCESHFLHFLFSVTSCRDSSPGFTHTDIFRGCFFSAVLCCSEGLLFWRTGQDSEYLFSPSHSPIDPGLLPIHGNGAINLCISFSAFYLVRGEHKPSCFSSSEFQRHLTSLQREGWLSQLIYLSI